MGVSKRLWQAQGGKSSKGKVITGDKAIDKALMNMGLKVAKKHAFAPEMKGVLNSKLRPAVQSSLPVVTGELRKAVKVRSIRGKGRSRKSYGLMLSTSNKVTAGGMFGAQFSGKVFYGGMVEYGTKLRQTKKKYFVPSIGVYTRNRGMMFGEMYFTKAFKPRRYLMLRRMEQLIMKRVLQIGNKYGGP